MALRIEPQAEPIPGYRLLERLGAGGYGEVWKAEAPGGLLKAIKIVRDEVRSGVEGGGLAQQELKALKRVQAVRHPYLLSIDRYDVIDGNLLIVTELADGSLWDRWRACRDAGLPGIPRGELLCYLGEAAEALDLMHTRHQLQHFDIKPQNLFLIHDHVKVADFGLVKDLKAVQGAMTGGVTPYYAAPETFDGKLSRHCDQYSLAIVYQELLTGERPFAGESIQQVIMQHLQAQPNLSALPSGDRPAVARALAKSVDERFANCTEFVNALRGIAIATPPPPRLVDATSTAFDESSVEQRIEREGGGVLAPTLVIGIGGAGGEVLRRLRTRLNSRFDSWPHIRLMAIDTDPAAAAGLRVDEQIIARLERAGHYLQGAAERTKGWLDSQHLARLGRQPATQSQRALGRLALTDHAAAIVGRLSAALEELGADETMAAAERATGLTLRSNRPRVVLVCGIGGGTGGGMVIDLGYMARHALALHGWRVADVAAWLLSPPIASATPGEVRAAANACATFIELNHFSQPHTTWRPLGLGAAGPPASRSAPFSETVVLPMRPSADHPSADGIGRAVDGLLRDWLTPLGRIGDARRSAGPRVAGVNCRTFGAVRFAWPRQAILEQAARHAAAVIVNRWIQADSTRLRDAVQAWLTEQWTACELGPEHLTARLESACAERIGGAPEAMIAGLPVSSGAPDESRIGQIEEWVGRPFRQDQPATPGRIGEALFAAAQELEDEWISRVCSLPELLLEQPDFRLAGAETAVCMLGEMSESLWANYGARADERLREAEQGRVRWESAAPATDASAEPSARETEYGRLRYQGMLLGRVAAVFRAVCSRLAAGLNELARARANVQAALSVLQNDAHIAAELPADVDGFLLPDHCATIADAARLAANALDRARRRETDRIAFDEVKSSFGGLHVADDAERCAAVLSEACRTEVAPLVREPGAQDSTGERHSETLHTLAAAWTSAAPLIESAASEWSAIEVPPGLAGARLVDIVRQNLAADVEVVMGDADGLALMREVPAMPVAALPGVGREALEAYGLVSRADGLSPHARFDVAEWCVLDRN